MFSFLIVLYLLCSHSLLSELCPLDLIAMHQNVCKTVAAQSNKASFTVRSELAALACDSFTGLWLQNVFLFFSFYFKLKLSQWAFVSVPSVNCSLRPISPVKISMLKHRACVCCALLYRLRVNVATSQPCALKRGQRSLLCFQDDLLVTISHWWMWCPTSVRAGPLQRGRCHSTPYSKLPANPTSASSYTHTQAHTHTLPCWQEHKGAAATDVWEGEGSWEDINGDSL